MYCKNCGRKLPDEAEFCDQCGCRVVGNHEKADQDKISKEEKKQNVKIMPLILGMVGIAVLAVGAAVWFQGAGLEKRQTKIEETSMEELQMEFLETDGSDADDPEFIKESNSETLEQSTTEVMMESSQEAETVEVKCYNKVVTGVANKI